MTQGTRRAICGLLIVAGFMMAVSVAVALDSDNDGMDDSYEAFFQLNPTNPADAGLNYDDDTLTNVQEAALWTDPYLGDTDADGWKDGVDANPLSRAVIEWGHPDFTTGDTYQYTGPAWWLSASKSGGAWTNEGWHVPASEGADVGSLSVGLDRAILTNPVVHEVTFFDHAGAELYMSLCDTNGTPVVTNVSGNLIGGTETDVTTRVSLPLDSNPAATVARLQRGSGDVTVYRSLLYVDQDGDGLDADQEAQLGTSDLNPDTTPPVIYCSAGSVGGNIAVNGGFENGGGSGSQSIDNWALFGNVYQEAITPRAGTRHAKMYGNFTGSWNFTGMFQDHSASAGEEWRGVVYVMTATGDAISGDNRVIVKLEFFDSSMTFISALESSAFDAQMPRDVYKPLVITGTTPANTATIRLTVLFIQSPDNAGGSVYIDDAALLKLVTDTTVTCLAEIPVPDSSVVIATDDTDPDPAVTFVGDFQGSGAGCPGSPLTVTRVWRATDEAGNTADCSVTFSVEDTALPVIQIVEQPANVLNNMGFEDGEGAGSSVLSNWVGFGRFYQESTTPRSGQRHSKLFSNFTGEPNLSGLFQDAITVPGDAWRLTAYALTTAGDAISGNNEAFIKIDFLDESYAWIGQSESFRLGAKMERDVYVPLTVSAVAPSGTRYVRAVLLFAGDASNSVGSIYFDDVTLERISLEPPAPDYGSVIASDNCDGSVIVSYVGDVTNNGTGCNGDPKVVTRTWRATDACGGYAEATQEFVFEDNRPPLLRKPADIAIDPSASTEPADTGYATAVGDVNETVTLNYSDEILSATPPAVSFIDRTWVAEDGCGNAATVLQRITLSLDVDGDGMPNSWEEQYGLDPEDASDAQGDLDGDGLSNSGEYVAATDPLVVDTDGDGVTDGEEVAMLSTNPLVPEFDGTSSCVDVAFGNETSATLGDWLVQGSEILSRDVRGFAEYSMECPTGDIYRLVVEATHIWTAGTCMPLTPVNKTDLILYIDGESLGRHRLIASNQYGHVSAFTPWLSAGTHTVRVRWDNVHSWVSLKIRKVRLEQLGGPDANANGTKDWVEYSLFSRNEATHIPSESVVSPVCVEGMSRFVARTSVNGVPVQQGITGSWYADLPLSVSGATATAISFENGAAEISTNILWVPWNVIEGGALEIRADDSVMLTALVIGETYGTVQLSVNGITNATTTAAEPMICNFPDPGEYVLSGTFSNEHVTASGVVTIRVASLDLPTNMLACMMGQTRRIAWTNAEAAPTFDVDETVTATYSNGTLGVLMSDVDSEHRLVLRLPGGGAVLGVMDLQGFWLRAAVDNYIWVVEEYEDSQLWENRILAKNLPQGVDIQLWSFIGGVTFDDLSLERWIDSGDFNVLEIYPFRLIHPNSVQASACHTVKAYQSGVLVGEAYYSGNPFPED